MRILDSYFFLAKEHHGEALLAMKQVDRSLISENAFIGWNDNNDDMATMRSHWELDEDMPFEAALQQASSLSVFLGLLNFDIIQEDGNITGLQWTGRYWQRYTYACLEAIARFLDEDTYFRVELGDSGEVYIWEIVDGKFFEKQEVSGES